MVKQRWGVIYKLTNKNNGKYYFGKTVNYKKRMNKHKNSWKKGTTYLSNSIKKHGWDNFQVEILIKDVPEEDLSALEISYIDIFDATNRKKGYNLTKGGEGLSGFKHSNETKKKITMSKKKHDAEKGTISLDKRINKWQVSSASPKKYIGRYNTQERAIEALNLYNEKKEILPSDLSKRRAGSGSISFHKKYKKWQVFSAKPRKNIGYYLTEEKATEALNLFIKTGIKMNPDRRKGSITLTKYNKYQLKYKRKYIGTFNTKELAQEALEKIIQFKK